MAPYAPGRMVYGCHPAGIRSKNMGFVTMTHGSGAQRAGGSEPHLFEGTFTRVARGLFEGHLRPEGACGPVRSLRSRGGGLPKYAIS